MPRCDCVLRLCEGVYTRIGEYAFRAQSTLAQRVSHRCPWAPSAAIRVYSFEQAVPRRASDAVEPAIEL